MKQLTVYLFLLLMLVQLAGSWVITADFRINRNFIANVLCENRNRPQVKCSGKCQLRKKMDHASSASSERPVTVQVPDTLFTLLDEPMILSPLAELRPDHHARYLFRVYTTVLRPIFHPPLFS